MYSGLKKSALKALRAMSSCFPIKKIRYTITTATANMYIQSSPLNSDTVNSEIPLIQADDDGMC